MDETDFNTYVDNEGWEEDLENESEESLSFGVSLFLSSVIMPTKT